jgi:ABC-type amino acid transport substrate-binding protein
MGLSLALVAASGLGLPLRARADDPRPSLFVFLQLDVKSNALEQALQKELPRLAVTVFGRLRDFQDSIASKNPDAIIAIAPLLEQARARPSLLGMRGGKEWEPYLLLMTAAAAAAGATKPSLAGKTVGIVDLLGRDGTQAFAAAAVGTPDVKVKRVAKIEDLLPLLEFSAADAVLIPSSAVKRFTERTRLAMAVRELPNARVGLPAVAVRNEKARAVIVQAIQQMEGETRSLLGIDSWSPR